jgi:hypothetical protein
MKTITFTIPGNQDYPKGNPIPYTRSTQKGQWKPAVRKYNEWKQYVRGCFLAHCVDEGLISNSEFRDLLYIHEDGKPIRYYQKQRCEMHLQIYFKDHAHADSDNIFKGIADALFENDKYLEGSFKFDYSLAGSVKVVIHFSDNEMAKPRRI